MIPHHAPVKPGCEPWRLHDDDPAATLAGIDLRPIGIDGAKLSRDQIMKLVEAWRSIRGYLDDEQVDSLIVSYSNYRQPTRVELEQIEANRLKNEEAAGKYRRQESLLERAEERLFNFANPPVEPIPRFLINGSAVCTPGNLTNIIAQAKAGKSAFIGAKIAAAICAGNEDVTRDTLGVTATAPGRKILVHFDTEQSLVDHDQLIRRALSRAGVDAKPSWLRSYGLAGFRVDEVREMLAAVLWQAQDDGGLFAVIIDGVADLASDVNDAKECNALVSELHNLAIKYDCPIISVIHENPGSDFGKMRGHLGSQLERKAESNIRLRKNGEITVVFSEKMRRAPIFEKDGPRFAFSKEAGMHLSTASLGRSRDDAKREKLHDQAEAVFLAAGVPSLSWAAMREGIAKSDGIGISGAGKRFDAMKALGVIKKNEVGHWSLAPATPQHPESTP